MGFLLFFSLCLIIATIIFVALTQIILPALERRPLFPAFRKSELSKKIDEKYGDVGELKEQVDELTDLINLAKKKTELQAKLEELDPTLNKETK